MTVTAASSPPPERSSAARRSRRIGALAALILSLLVGAALVSISPGAAGAFGLPSAVVSAPPAVAPPVQWRWPVPPPIRVVSPFRAPASPYASGHRGIDIVVERGATIVAPESGTINFAGAVAGRNVVAIDHGGGIVSAIEPVDALVSRGQAVAAGDPIGVVSAGGHCDSGCVHFGVRIDGEYVSPFLFLGGIPRAVLLPS
ncbi:M23 family metallopeptidase [Agromyces mariniharenae]|nr:M23 family metallopeptidase [Agromyces mariniharenae]